MVPLLLQRNSGNSHPRRRQRLPLPWMAVLFLAALIIIPTEACIDDDAWIAQLAANNNIPNINGCQDAIGFCGIPNNNVQGILVRSLCCRTCGIENNADSEDFDALADEVGGDGGDCKDIDDATFGQVVAAVGSSSPDSFAQIISTTGTSEGTDGQSSCSKIANPRLGICEAESKTGLLARSLCCASCSPPVPENDLPPTDKPLELFYVGGQSECTGQAESGDLFADADTYPELQGPIEGVWFAGYHEQGGVDRFFIRPLAADVDRRQFGPEVSFGQRVYEATEGRSNILMVKYCVGGSNVRFQWNPETPENDWDRDADDGTAAWLENNANLVLAPKKASKKHLFVNMAYTVRRTQETLDAAGIPYQWSGIVWLQGAGDKYASATGDPGDVWEFFGENTARVWNGFRDQLSVPSGEVVPIIDTGATGNNQLRSGKEHATQIVDGCKAVSVNYGISATDDRADGCVITPSNPCTGASGTFQDLGVFDYFGWDPLVPDELKPEASRDLTQTFNWWTRFPNNLHSAYEGMVLKGQMLANAYLREFSDVDVSVYRGDDPAVLFPYDKCPDGILPSLDNLCWIDYRTDPDADGLCNRHENANTNKNNNNSNGEQEIGLLEDSSAVALSSVSTNLRTALVVAIAVIMVGV